MELRVLLTGRVVRALENRTRSSTLSIGASLIRRTPGIVVSGALLAFPASVCNGWARLWGLAQGREWHRSKTCESSAFTRTALSTAWRAQKQIAAVNYQCFRPGFHAVGMTQICKVRFPPKTQPNTNAARASVDPTALPSAAGYQYAPGSQTYEDYRRR